MYCKNCGKPISSIANECPYCKSKVNKTNEIDNQLTRYITTFYKNFFAYIIVQKKFLIIQIFFIKASNQIIGN